MSETQKVDEDTLETAREYVKQLELGEQEKADELLSELTNLRESQLFNELGKLTRDFHEALNSFSSDDRIATLAEDEIPDAKERLSFVITKTSEAAHKTLNAVEDAIPVCENLETAMKGIGAEWEKFLGRELKPEEFRALSAKIHTFFGSSTDDLGNIKSQLNDILMAQDFQDITGQVIGRVITLVGEVEKSLVELVKLGGGLSATGTGETESKEKEPEKGVLEGPQVPGLESADIVSGQDDVDELLSSLGF